MEICLQFHDTMCKTFWANSYMVQRMLMYKKEKFILWAVKQAPERSKVLLSLQFYQELFYYYFFLRRKNKKKYKKSINFDRTTIHFSTDVKELHDR